MLRASPISKDVPVSATRPVMPRPIRVGRAHRIARQCARQVSAERDEHEIVVVTEKHAAVVVVDQESELVGDGEPDLGHVVESRQLSGEALQHLQMSDRAHVVTADRLLGGTLTVALVEGNDEAFPLDLAVIIAASAHATLARVRRVGGPDCDPRRRAEASYGFGVEPRQLLTDTLGERGRAPEVAGREDDRELLAADATHHVALANGGAKNLCDLLEVIADAMSVDVVHLLEVVEVEHHDGHGVVGFRCGQECLAQAVVERAVVVETGERIRLGLVLEARADVALSIASAAASPNRLASRNSSSENAASSPTR